MLTHANCSRNAVKCAMLTTMQGKEQSAMRQTDKGLSIIVEEISI